MPIDRIEKTDPTLYRVEQAGDRGQRRGQQEYQGKEKDKFEKKPSVWRRILTMSTPLSRPPTILAGKPLGLPVRPGPIHDEEESLTFSERLLVAWGVLDPNGRPRPGVILTYVLVLGMILGATGLIVGMTLWR